MMFLKKTFPFFLPFTLFAATDSIEDFNQRLTAVEKQVKKKTFYNAPANAHVMDSYGLFLTGDLLYWKAEENGLTYAFKADTATIPQLQGTLHLKDPHFDWDLGFRVGFGFNIPHDHWDFYANWTRLYTSAKSHCHAHDDEGLFPVYATASGPVGDEFVTQAKSHWKLFLNILDTELGKEYYVGCKLSLRPHLDLRTVFIDQTFTLHYNTPSVNFFDRVRLKNDYWGIGPRVGLDLQWWWGYGFSFSGNAALSLVYGNFSIHQKEEVEGSPEDTIHFRKHLHTGRTIADLGIYFNWDHMFFCDTFHVGLKAGWEQHVFFEQNQFFRFLDPDFQGSIVSNQGNLMLQGWTFSMRIDF